jgi:hypothetical protein
MDDNSKGGAPTLFRGEYCQMLIDHMAKGYSYESFAAVIDVDRSTLYAWESIHEGFSDAKKKAFEKNLLFWEKQGIDGLYSETEYDKNTGKPSRSKSINSSIWNINMKNRHKWRDKQPDEEPQVNVTVNNVTNLPDDQLNAKIEEKMKKLGGK